MPSPLISFNHSPYWYVHSFQLFHSFISYVLISFNCPFFFRFDQLFKLIFSTSSLLLFIMILRLTSVNRSFLITLNTASFFSSMYSFHSVTFFLVLREFIPFVPLEHLFSALLSVFRSCSSFIYYSIVALDARSSHYSHLLAGTLRHVFAVAFLFCIVLISSSVVRFSLSFSIFFIHAK